MFDWQYSKIKDLPLLIEDGDRSKRYPKREEFTDDNIIFLNSTCIQNGILDLTYTNYISESKYDEITKGRLRYNDIVMTTRGNGIGNVALFNLENKIGLINAQLLILRANEEILLQEYLYYFLTSEYFQKQVRIISSGGAQPQLPIKLLKEIEICIPPLNYQKTIVRKLLDFDRLINNHVGIQRYYSKLKKGLMQHLLIRGIGHTKFKQTKIGLREYEVPEEWDIVELGSLARVKRGASPRPIDDPDYFGGKIGWIRISDLTKSGKYLEETKQNLSDLGVSKSVRVYPGEILMSICATIGKPAITGLDGCIHDGIVAFKKLDNSVHPEFLYYSLLRLQNELTAKGQTGTQANLNTGIVNRTRIPLPPLAEQKKIASILSEIDGSIGMENQFVQKLTLIKKGLMQILLTGKVRVKT